MPDGEWERERKVKERKNRRRAILYSCEGIGIQNGVARLPRRVCNVTSFLMTNERLTFERGEEGEGLSKNTRKMILKQ